MALAITDKPNTDGPSADYPYGKVRDKTLSAAGTPANTIVNTDMHQFFAKLMDYAGVTPNGLPDNEYSGWQLMESLMALMGGVKTTVIEIGAWDIQANQTITLVAPIDLTKVVSIKVTIIADSTGRRFDFAPGADQISTGGNITLVATTGGPFDSGNYNDTGINRGYVIIQYTDDL